MRDKLLIKKKSEKDLFAESLGIKRKSYFKLLGSAVKYLFRIVSVILGTFITLYVMVYMGEHYLIVFKDMSLVAASIVFLLLSLYHISSVVYEADVKLAKDIYVSLSTWLSPDEALHVTRRILEAVDRNDFSIANTIASMYANRVLLPKMLPTLKEQLKDEIIDELKLEITAVPPLNIENISKVENTNGRQKTVSIVARCPEHGVLKPTEVFRENGHLYCIYCGREVK